MRVRLSLTARKLRNLKPHNSPQWTFLNLLYVNFSALFVDSRARAIASVQPSGLFNKYLGWRSKFRSGTVYVLPVLVCLGNACKMIIIKHVLKITFFVIPKIFDRSIISYPVLVRFLSLIPFSRPAFLKLCSAPFFKVLRRTMNVTHWKSIGFHSSHVGVYCLTMSANHLHKTFLGDAKHIRGLNHSSQFPPLNAPVFLGVPRLETFEKPWPRPCRKLVTAAMCSEPRLIRFRFDRRFYPV